MTDLPWFPGDPRPSVSQPPKCRHPKRGRSPRGDQLVCKCGHVIDPRRQRAGGWSRRKGVGTSAAVADFLGLEDVEYAKLPWDVQGAAARIQCKRTMEGCGPQRAAGLLAPIGWDGQHLPVVFYVPPGKKIAGPKGACWVWFAHWESFHGPKLPPGATLHSFGSGPLIAMPLPVFRDWHIADRALPCARADAARADTAALDRYIPQRDEAGYIDAEMCRAVSCCELACYEDPGCSCEGCAQPAPAPGIDVEALARALPNALSLASEQDQTHDYSEEPGSPYVRFLAAAIAAAYAKEVTHD